MFLEKFAKIVALLKDARSVITRLLFLQEPRTAHQLILLQGLLDQIQTAIISMRADFIEMIFPHEPAKANDSGPPTVRLIRRSTAGERSGAPPFDRRHNVRDRRQLHTYLSSDPRSGIADRRRRKKQAAPLESAIYPLS